MQGFSRGTGLLGPWLNQPLPGQWHALNIELMDTLYCTYKASYTLQTLVQKLQQETMRGGLDVRHVENDGAAGADDGDTLAAAAAAAATTTNTFFVHQRWRHGLIAVTLKNQVSGADTTTVAQGQTPCGAQTH